MGLKFKKEAKQGQEKTNHTDFENDFENKNYSKKMEMARELKRIGLPENVIFRLINLKIEKGELD